MGRTQQDLDDLLCVIRREAHSDEEYASWELAFNTCLAVNDDTQKMRPCVTLDERFEAVASVAHRVMPLVKLSNRLRYELLQAAREAVAAGAGGRLAEVVARAGAYAERWDELYMQQNPGQPVPSEGFPPREGH